MSKLYRIPRYAAIDELIGQWKDVNNEDIFNNLFHKTGGYIEMGSGQYQYVEEKGILTLPGGKYACFTTSVFYKSQWRSHSFPKILAK